MKRSYQIKFTSLIILLLITTVSFAQPATLNITMNIDFDGWNRNNPNTWYDQITFTDDGDYDLSTPTLDPNPDNNNNGRFFRSKVRPNQRLEWGSSYQNAPDDFQRIILISVMRNPSPGMGGNEILDSPWYNSDDDGETIEGRARNQDLTLQIERYVVSFAVYYGTDDEGNHDYDIYTVDPIIRGHDN